MDLLSLSEFSSNVGECHVLQRSNSPISLICKRSTVLLVHFRRFGSECTKYEITRILIMVAHFSKSVAHLHEALFHDKAEAQSRRRMEFLPGLHMSCTTYCTLYATY